MSHSEPCLGSRVFHRGVDGKPSAEASSLGVNGGTSGRVPSLAAISPSCGGGSGGGRCVGGGSGGGRPVGGGSGGGRGVGGGSGGGRGDTVRACEGIS